MRLMMLRSVKRRSNISREVAQSAVETNAGRSLLDTLENPDYDIGEGSRINIYTDNELMGHLIQVPTDYGKLQVGYNGSEVTHADLLLNNENIPESLQDTISGEIKWPSDQMACQLFRAGTERIDFCRNTTESWKKASLNR